jgi:hypothetical protein
MQNSLENGNTLFAIIFNIEMVLKLVALGKFYFYDKWSIFDMFIVIGTNLGILMNILNVGGNISSAASVVRGFRIMRIFRLIRSSVHIRLIMDTLINIMPQITNIMSLIFILFFIYASLGINLFSTIKLRGELNEKNNF